MDREPKRLISRIMEYCALFALSAFLLRLGVAYLKDIWVVLAVIIGVVAVAVAIYRIRKHETYW